jgi:hypothetical protein
MSSEYSGAVTTSRNNTPLPDSTGHNQPQPWQSWGSTVRYTVVRLAEVMPYIAVLAWQAYPRH